jgi:HEAT repeat protein
MMLVSVDCQKPSPKNADDEVRAWLRRAPRERLSSPGVHYPDYEEWASAGSRIENIDSLLIELFHEADDFARYDIVMAFGFLGVEDSIPLLIELLDPDRQCDGCSVPCIWDKSTRCLHTAAVEALFELAPSASPEAVDALCKLLLAIRHDNDLRVTVAMTLAHIGDPVARPSLEKALQMTEQELQEAQRNTEIRLTELRRALDSLPN